MIRPLDFDYVVNEILGGYDIFLLVAIAMLFYFGGKYRMPTRVQTYMLMLFCFIFGILSDNLLYFGVCLIIFIIAFVVKKIYNKD